MSLTSLTEALTLTPGDDGARVARLSGDVSNGPMGAPPQAGFPFGGLLAALAVGAMRDGLDLRPPLRSLTVQYLAAAAYGPLSFRPRLLRGGRSIAFAAVEADQDGRRILAASATFGADTAGPARCEIQAVPPPVEGLDPGLTLSGPMTPRFAQHLDYRYPEAPRILGGNADRPAVERVWMRRRDGAPLDEATLCYMLDALYPPAWTISAAPPMMASVDLRYDILADPTAERAPDGWVFFEFRMLDLGGGWTVDDATAWGADGRPLAVARQRRKLAPDRAARRSA